MTFLIDQYPLVVQPTLAKLLGLNKAIVLQQLHYWLSNPKVGVWHEGYKWIHNTYDEWQENFPFWSVDTIQRSILSLEKDGIIVSARFAPSAYDKTKSYRIDYDVLASTLAAICGEDYSSLPQSIQRLRPETTNTNTASDEKPSSPPIDLPIEWKMVAGEEITRADLAKEKERQMVDAANIIATGAGAHARWYYEMALAFMTARDIVIPESKRKAQRKAIKAMLEAKVSPTNVFEATKKLMDAGMTVTDLYSVEKTAVDLANQPTVSGHTFIEGV